jgi:hypothetical protein
MNVLNKVKDYGFRSEFKTSLLCLLFVFPNFNAQAIDVAVVETAGGGYGGGAAVVAQLNDDTFFDFTATLVDPFGVDSAAELANYDAVVLGGSGLGIDPIWTTAMASALKVFVEGGGGVLMTGWGLWNSGPGGGPANAESAAILDTFVPGDIVNGYSFFSSCCLPGTSIVLTDLSHPITDGLPDSFSYGFGCCLEYNSHDLQPGDVSLGTPSKQFSGPANALIYRENIGAGNGRSVYLGALHLGSVSAYDSVQSGLRSGSGDQLLEQALAWLGSHYDADADPVVADTDDDGVLDDVDNCPYTIIPEGVPTVELKPNHWALTHWALTDDDPVFKFDTFIKGKGKGPNRSYNIEDTAGCSCEQIIEAQGLGGGHAKHGCSISVMDDWVELVTP